MMFAVRPSEIFTVHELRIAHLHYDPATGLISFAASVSDNDGSTTIASYAIARPAARSERQLRKLVEQRVRELMALPSLSGKPVSGPH